MKLLVADDSISFRELISKDLSDWGYQFDIVENGIEALLSLSRTEYQALILDIDMPELNGLELAEVISCSKNSLSNSLPIIMLTGTESQWLTSMAWATGVNIILKKPYGDDLKEALAKLRSKND